MSCPDCGFAGTGVHVCSQALVDEMERQSQPLDVPASAWINTSARGGPFGWWHDPKLEYATEYVPVALLDAKHAKLVEVADRMRAKLAAVEAERDAILRNGDAATVGFEAAVTALRAERDALLAEPRTAGCPVHAGQVHGREAEELRSSIEKLLNSGRSALLSWEVQKVLDSVDARDSLAHREQRTATAGPEDRLIGAAAILEEP